MILDIRRPALRLVIAVAACGGSLAALAGCSRDQPPASPNAATAAPARLPGEDPRAAPMPPPKGARK